MLILQGRTADFRAGDSRHRQNWVYVLSLEGDAGETTTLDDGSTRLPARSPNLNAYAERFVRTIKESCLERMILFGEQSLRRVTGEFLAHYHRERNHQGLDNRLIFPGPASTDLAAPIERRQRLGGTLNYYYRQAA